MEGRRVYCREDIDTYSYVHEYIAMYNQYCLPKMCKKVETIDKRNEQLWFERHSKRL